MPHCLIKRHPLKLGRGLVSVAVTSQMPLLVNDVATDERYVPIVPGMASELVVPLLHKKRPLGALNILSRHKDQFTAADMALLRQFAAHVSVGPIVLRCQSAWAAKDPFYELGAALAAARAICPARPTRSRSRSCRCASPSTPTATPSSAISRR